MAKTMALIDPNKLIILDRDGVINEDSDQYVKSLEEWLPIKGSIEAIADLSKAGYTLCVATNQSGLARNYFDESTLHAMHKKLTNLVSEKGGIIHTIEYCPHGPDDNCECRKPLPGMFKKIAETFELSDLSGSYTIGDSARDLVAGCELNSQPVLVKTGKGLKTISAKNHPENTLIFDDLNAFAKHLLSSHSLKN